MIGAKDSLLRQSVARGSAGLVPQNQTHRRYPCPLALLNDLDLLQVMDVTHLVLCLEAKPNNRHSLRPVE